MPTSFDYHADPRRNDGTAIHPSATQAKHFHRRLRSMRFRSVVGTAPQRTLPANQLQIP